MSEDGISKAHNDAIYPILQMIIDHDRGEAAQWVLLETLCLGIGRLHQRSGRETALFVETIAERIATGERQ